MQRSKGLIAADCSNGMSACCTAGPTVR